MVGVALRSHTFASRRNWQNARGTRINPVVAPVQRRGDWYQSRAFLGL